MPDLPGLLAGQEGLGLLASVALIAGLVRGFSGFGTALIYMPMAGQVLSPLGAIVTLTMMDVIGPLPNVVRAAKVCERADVARLAVGLLAALPLGLFLLERLPQEGFRYLVSALALVLVALLAGGFRYRGRLSAPLVMGIGALGGFLGGLTGLAGPPAIMLYMASRKPAHVIRANLLLYLAAVDVVMVSLLALTGRLHGETVILGLLLSIPYMLGNVLGARLFRPGRERTYRLVAYVLIAASALMGLPLWSGLGG